MSGPIAIVLTLNLNGIGIHSQDPPNWIPDSKRSHVTRARLDVVFLFFLSVTMAASLPLLMLFLLTILQSCIVITNAFLVTGTFAAGSRSISPQQRSATIDSTNLVRGRDRYRNSTVPPAHAVAQALGVEPPADAHPRVWKRAYEFQKFMTPFLHGTLPNSSLNVYCVWWKALSSLGPTENDDDNNSVIQNDILRDDGLTYDLLPTMTRPLLKLFRTRFPRLHHANVELRTVYLHKAVLAAVAESSSNAQLKRTRLVTFGAGYDMRSTRFLTESSAAASQNNTPLIHAAYELDLPAVIAAKRAALTSTRFQRRRQRRTGKANPLQLPTLVPVDMNDLDRVRDVLEEILHNDDGDDEWHTIFLFEAVLIYLQPGIPAALLQLCANATAGSSSSSALCFADRLENIPGGNHTAAQDELAQRGWRLVDWMPKPGLARHMGRAEQI